MFPLRFVADYTTLCATLVCMMNEIIASLDSEIRALKQVRAMLAGTGNGASRDRRKGKRTWTMSAEAREKIAAAQRKRWAKQKSAAK
jgi:hypothetical protein